jgi:chemotaxis protein CheD
MAEVHVAKGNSQFTCMGLGSCVGLVALDPDSNVSGIAHFMLPESLPNKLVDQPGKFVDTGMEHLIAEMESMGASREHINVAIFGGAQVMHTSRSLGEWAQIGERNVKSAKHHSERLGLNVVAEDTGGCMVRTVQFYAESGLVRIRVVGQDEKDLCNLREN